MKFSLGVPLMHPGEETGFLGGEDLAELAQAAAIMLVHLS